jgi:hypothetical protein
LLFCAVVSDIFLLLDDICEQGRIIIEREKKSREKQGNAGAAWITEQFEKSSTTEMSMASAGRPICISITGKGCFAAMRRGFVV